MTNAERSSYFGRQHRFLIAALLSFCLLLFACGGGGSGTQSPPPVTPPSSIVTSLEVLFPPSPNAPYYTDTQSYLMNNPDALGANVAVKWASVDQGPGASPQYLWTSTDSLLQPWISAGKKVNLVVWPVAYASTNDSTPGYVLSSLGTANTTTCNSEVIPNYFASGFQAPYKAFMAAVIQHYAQNPAVGYIRFGLAQGGETYPAKGFDADALCSNSFKGSGGWGWTSSSWITYLTSLLDYEKSLNSPKQLMVGINTVEGDLSIPDSVATRAVQDGIGFGSQGLQLRDMSAYASGDACTADWCNLFDQYTGKVPLELQTLSQSNPSGAGPTGSLLDLLPFAVQRHATIIEIYWQDWLIAFDPAYPGYDVAYAPAFKSAAEGKGQ